jgi:prevent-host-death family protein
MRAINIVDDIKPISEFRANSAAVIEQVRESGRPVVLTQNGRSAAVLLDVRVYEQLMEKLEVLADIHLAERQIERNEGIPHEKAKEMVLAGIRS